MGTLMIHWRPLLYVGLGLLILNPAWGSLAGSPDAVSSNYRYAGDDLGAVCGPQETTIKLWAPTAKDVRLVLFDDAAQESSRIVSLARDKDGVWFASLKGDMDGKYYLYEITHQEPGSDKPTVYRVNDPYARGCSANTEIGRAHV
jgi:pullulanase